MAETSIDVFYEYHHFVADMFHNKIYGSIKDIFTVVGVPGQSKYGGSYQ
jgi:hypothetical protein